MVDYFYNSTGTIDLSKIQFQGSFFNGLSKQTFDEQLIGNLSKTPKFANQFNFMRLMFTEVSLKEEEKDEKDEKEGKDEKIS